MDWNRLLNGERQRIYKRQGGSSDNRSEFEKDYHRIIGSASFRRLQDKTQVFPLDKSDFIRTRLTHSMEVSSIAKSLGQSVGAELKRKGYITAEQAAGIEDILLCSGLLHDIGNPPFGHFGETVIRDWFRENLSKIMYKGKPVSEWLNRQMREDLYNFEGNAQSLRVVTKLHYLVDEHGMNLTKALLNTIIKYPVSSDQIDRKSGDIHTKKMGFFYGDRKNFKDIVDSTGAGDRRHPLAYLLEAADDIAYSTADLEDGFKKGILTFSRLQECLCCNHYEKKRGQQVYEKCEYAAQRLQKLYQRGMDNNEPDPELYAVQNWIISMQGVLIQSAAKSFMEHYEDIMSGRRKTDLFKGTESEVLIGVLKETALEYVFNHKEIVKLEIAASSIIEFLLKELVNAAVKYDTDEKMTQKERKLMDLISSNYKRVYKLSAEGIGDSENVEGEKLYLRMLLVTDSISGMTDHYAKSLYQELNGIY